MKPAEARGRTWTAVLPAMFLPVAASLAYFVVWSGHPAARLLYAGTKVFALLWPLLALRLILGEPLPRPDLRDPVHRRALPLGFLTGAAVVGLMVLLIRGPLGGLLQASTPAIAAKARQLGILEHYAAFALFLALANSLVEEYYWRWFVFGRLSLVVRPAAAHLMAGAAFGLHHTVVAVTFFGPEAGLPLGLAVACGGVMWSLMCRRQRTLAGAWVSHLLVDVGIMGTGWYILF